MTERVVALGEIGGHLPDHPWIVIFGGATREGNRRARRAIRNVLGSDIGAIWFDGYSERIPEHGVERVPLDFPVPDHRVVIVDYATKERSHWLNRMVDGVPETLLGAVVKAEELVPTSSNGQVSLMTRVRRGFVTVLAFLQKKILKRISLIFLGRVGWRIVRDDVAHLSKRAPAPDLIIYGDDQGLTQAWHAARLWPDAKTSMEYEAP